MNVQKNFKTLQNLQSMEIDSKGIMWVLGSDCPGKLVLLDLNDGGKVVYSYTIPEDICTRKGCWLNDIILEERFEGYAYISEASNSDPGLIVFSRKQGKAWKLRVSSMLADVNVVNYTVGGVLVNTWLNVDSLAMAPVPKDRSEDRKIFYSPLSSRSLYSISDRILRNETVFCGIEWRTHVEFLLCRPSNSDGMIVDTRGDLYMGYLTKFAIAKTVSTSVEKIVWPDSFAIDDDGNLYNLADSVNRFLNNNGPLQIPKKPIIRILKMHTVTKSYLHTAL
ncbi:PREDICTED: protein yellow-like [Nicrophorus vespilloides]|uniref:Protein yellow-like n=1 Tax=Nicrophorus vespilloides TaxID=110193 RepID=A0ABM1M5K9_NICVS|nr:PREDICTED: protein yellow-like [Nicrophorus vespilloides]